jgi:glucose-1-phosphate cytidylyltransferase
MANIQSTPVFILAGGRGTRVAEETHAIPKPMIEVGDIPVLLHLMRWYYAAGFQEFVICAGYRAWQIKEYFLSYSWRRTDVELDMRNPQDPQVVGHGVSALQEKWRVRVIDTGLDCMTGGRIARAFDAVSKTHSLETFAVTYGDGLSNVDLAAEFAFHQQHKNVGTMLGVHPPARFGELEIGTDHRVTAFLEKPQSRQGYINGGFMFFQKDFRKYLSDQDSCVLEREPLSKLAKDGGLNVFKHEGFWQPMDTLRDKQVLQEMWEQGKAPWIAKT